MKYQTLCLASIIRPWIFFCFVFLCCRYCFDDETITRSGIESLEVTQKSWTMIVLKKRRGVGNGEYTAQREVTLNLEEDNVPDSCMSASSSKIGVGDSGHCRASCSFCKKKCYAATKYAWIDPVSEKSVHCLVCKKSCLYGFLGLTDDREDTVRYLYSLEYVVWV